MTTQTASLLDRIPMLTGLIGMTLYEGPVIIRSQAHGTSACYSYGGCRCEACRKANAERIRTWYQGKRADNNYSVKLDRDSDS